MKKYGEKLQSLLRSALVPLLLFTLMWIGYFKVYGNFHKVDNDLYRSAQLYSFNLPLYLKKHDIRSVINLRGASNEKWYQEELRICKENNVTHYDFGIPDRRILPQKRMDALVDLMKKAPKPLLVHCKAGADRTSLASALYLYAIKHDPNADRAISVIYGHFPWLSSKTKAMDRSFENYKKSMKKE